MVTRNRIQKAAAAVVLSLCLAGPAAAQDGQATASEAVEKVRQAAAYLAARGEKGLASFSDWTSPFAWKDSYVFVFRCAAGRTAAYPVEGYTHVAIDKVVDAKGTVIGPKLCDAAAAKDGGWVEYWFPKPNETEPSRKVSYMRHVPGTDYDVGAGVYDTKLSLQELDRLVE